MSRTINNRRKKRNRRRRKPRRPLFSTTNWANSPAIKLLIKELEAMPPLPPGVMDAMNHFWRMMQR